MSNEGMFDLVFEGGGAKGLAFVGTLRALEEAGVQPGRLLGTSAGAITATLIAAGYTAATILPTLTEKLPDGQARFSTFLDSPKGFDDEVILNSRFAQRLKDIDLPFIPERIEQKVDRALIGALVGIPVFRQYFSLVERGGLYEGEAFRQWMYERLNDADTLGDATLADFHEHTGKELTVTGADVTDRRLLILNHRTAPSLPVVWAVRMSMSVPFLWHEVVWRPEWGLYRGRDMSGHAVVDGGVLANFPIELFLSREPHITNIMGEATSGRVLGCLIDEDTPVPDTSPLPPGFQLPHIATLRRLLDLLNTMMQAHDKLVLEEYANLVLRLPAGGYGTTEFDMSDDRMEKIINAGYGNTVAYLSNMTALESTAEEYQPSAHVEDLARDILGQ